MLKNEIYIVIPAYNEEKRLGELLKDLERYKLPVVIVDDGSVDRTSVVAQKFGVVVLRRCVNLGGSKGAALKTGVEYAFNLGAKAVVMMDSDGQHSATDLPKFIDALNSGYDVVLGSRNFSMGVPLVRFLGNKLISVLVNLLYGIYVSDILCGYRALTLKAYEKLRWESLYYAVETEMIVKLSETKLEYCEVPVKNVYYDKVKGMTVIDAVSIIMDIIRWKF